MSLITRTEVAFLFLSGVQSNLLHPLRHSFGQCFSEISGRCFDEIIVPINRTQRPTHRALLSQSRMEVQDPL